MSMVDIVRRIKDLAARVGRLESAEHRTAFGRDVLGPVDYIHFRESTAPAGYSWASGAVFTTPGAGTYTYGHKSDYLKLTTVGALAFLYRSVTTYLSKTISARVFLGDAGAIGLRIDDGTDNNYSEFNIYHAGGTNVAEVRCRNRVGAGAVTTLHSSSAGLGELPRVISISMSNNAGQHIDYFSFLNEAGQAFAIASAASASWAVTRAGILVKRDSGSGSSFCDWLYTDMT